jgi:hypothetical protein
MIRLTLNSIYVVNNVVNKLGINQSFIPVRIKMIQAELSKMRIISFDRL